MEIYMILQDKVQNIALMSRQLLSENNLNMILLIFQNYILTQSLCKFLLCFSKWGFQGRQEPNMIISTP